MRLKKQIKDLKNTVKIGIGKIKGSKKRINKNSENGEKEGKLVRCGGSRPDPILLSPN